MVAVKVKETMSMHSALKRAVLALAKSVLNNVVTCGRFSCTMLLYPRTLKKDLTEISRVFR